MFSNGLCILTLVITFNGGYGLDEGELCKLNNGATGRCRMLRDCHSAIVCLKENITPVTCSFQGTVPIVCCSESGPQSATITRTTTRTSRSSGPLPVGEISKQKCREYATHVFELVEPPILSPSKLVNVSRCVIASVPLILGGLQARPGEFPHQALLGFGEDNEKNWLCGGTLISEEFILTAAHCVKSREFGPVKYIRLGDLDFSTNDDANLQDINVAEVITHPEWKLPIQYNDIALLRLAHPVKFNRFIRPACLQTSFNILNSTKVRYFATGWGQLEYGSNAGTKLLKVILENINQKQCNTAYSSSGKKILPNVIREESQMCAGGMERDTCQDETGGPLQIYHNDVYCMYKIVGVTSFGKTCGLGNKPGVYTRVSHYIEWIENIVWPQT